MPESELLATDTNPSHEKPMVILQGPSSLSNELAADALESKHTLHYQVIIRFTINNN